MFFRNQEYTFGKRTATSSTTSLSMSPDTERLTERDILLYPAPAVLGLLPVFGRSITTMTSSSSTAPLPLTGTFPKQVGWGDNPSEVPGLSNERDT